ncbi:unnamed protein product [Blepharisma stoltei]|uniref:NADH:ubiquinone reductase (H(+)-translocating) n=1 Tax=Blepharisma stoltei TaxID=1481888 RepID=A0AAU9JAV4_9CILI|nr:unnamed protein product [Blepharisma stoltei]
MIALAEDIVSTKGPIFFPFLIGSALWYINPLVPNSVGRSFSGCEFITIGMTTSPFSSISLSVLVLSQYVLKYAVYVADAIWTLTNKLIISVFWMSEENP